MPFLRYSHAKVVSPHVTHAQWGKIRTSGLVAKIGGNLDENLVVRAGELFNKTFNPDDFLLTHATIIASVDTFVPPGTKTGSVLVDGFRVNRRFASYRVQPSTAKFINHNNDAWSRPVLLKAYSTFIGGHNFVEHVQVEELSKGRIIDAVARDIGDSVYVDILIATDRKHKDLIEAIESGKMSTLSMGCFLPGTQVSLADGRRVSIEEVQPGDMVLTHKGRSREVLNKQIRVGSWNVRTIRAVGIPTALTATDNHPFLVCRQSEICACGCGNLLPAYKGGRRNATRGLRRRFLTGHDKRVFNPNNTYSLEEARSRRSRMDAIKNPAPVWVRADELRVGDFLCFPRALGEGCGTTDGKARLLGYFLSEGCFLKIKGIPAETQFCFSADEKDTFAAEVVELLKKEFPGNEPWLQERTDRNTCTVHVSGKETAAWFFRHGGEYGNLKRLSAEVMGWTVENHKNLIGTWLNGDGHQHKIHGNTSGSTTSYDLACQMHFLMARCGMFARMECRIGTRTVEIREVVNGGFVRDEISGRLPAFNLVIGKTFARNLFGHTVKAVSGSAFKSQGPRISDDATMFPVTSIEQGFYEGPVHNMEVAEDNSYIVEGAVSHNCTVDGTVCTKCGHWAADETEMCFPPETRVLKADGKYAPIREIVPGDLVLTHAGNHRPVVNVMSRQHDGHVTVLKVDGIPDEIRATTGHRFWVVRPATQCACGCGGQLHRTVEHERGSVKAFSRRFLPGHNGRVWNSDAAKNIMAFDEYREMFKVAPEFVPAKDIRKGDYLTFPIPKETKATVDATVPRARLIGFFLAEGCFVKREGKRVGVEFSFGPHERDTLAAEVSRLLDAEWGRDERKTGDTDWKDLVAAKGMKPVRRRNGSKAVPADAQCPSCGAPVEYVYAAGFAPKADCFQCKVCGRNWVAGANRSVKSRIYPKGDACVVRVMSADAAEWFFRFCGEYAGGKELHADVMLWSPDIQRHVLFGWLGGDGTQCRMGIVGNTASFNLVGQMHVLAARCGWYGRKQVLFEKRASSFAETVNGSGSLAVRGADGYLPSFSLTLPEPIGFGGEVRFHEPDGRRPTMAAVTDSFKRIGDWFLYRVRDVWNECYSGPVCNIEVAEDESYVVEGVAVHNCPHVRYEKGNTFFDDQGRKHIVAELCGNEDIAPHGGVHFIEASWVEQPAFTGAVMRNIIRPTEETIRLAQHVLKTPPPQWTADSYLKAARRAENAAEGTVVVKASNFKTSDMTRGGRRFTVTSEIPEKNPDDAVWAGADPFLAGWNGDGEEPDGSVVPTEPKQVPGDPLKQVEDDLEKHLLDRVVQRVREKMKGENVENALNPTPSSAATNDNAVKEGKLYRAGLSTLVRKASGNADLVDSIAEFNRLAGIDIPVKIYRAALAVGPTTEHRSVQAFLKACAKEIGRDPSLHEAKTMLRLCKLLSQGKSLRGQKWPPDRGDT